MKHLRLTVAVDAERAPPFFTLLAASPGIEETRLLELDGAGDDQVTLLYAIEGDPTAFAEQVPETAGVESVRLSDTRRGLTYALVDLRPAETPLFGAIHRASARPGLVVRTPIVYRDGRMDARVVGDPAALQDGLDEAPDGVTVQVDEIGGPHAGRDRPETALSARQREAVEVAAALGYYDQPRGATHEDVAAELGCAPSTASDHLQNAEAKLVAVVLSDFGPGG